MRESRRGGLLRGAQLQAAELRATGFIHSVGVMSALPGNRTSNSVSVLNYYNNTKSVPFSSYALKIAKVYSGKYTNKTNK